MRAWVRAWVVQVASACRVSVPVTQRGRELATPAWLLPASLAVITAVLEAKRALGDMAVPDAIVAHVAREAVGSLEAAARYCGPTRSDVPTASYQCLVAYFHSGEAAAQAMPLLVACVKAAQAVVDAAALAGGQQVLAVLQHVLAVTTAARRAPQPTLFHACVPAMSFLVSSCACSTQLHSDAATAAKAAAAIRDLLASFLSAVNDRSPPPVVAAIAHCCRTTAAFTAVHRVAALSTLPNISHAMPPAAKPIVRGHVHERGAFSLMRVMHVSSARPGSSGAVCVATNLWSVGLARYNAGCWRCASTRRCVAPAGGDYPR